MGSDPLVTREEAERFHRHASWLADSGRTSIDVPLLLADMARCAATVEHLYAENERLHGVVAAMDREVDAANSRAVDTEAENERLQREVGRFQAWVSRLTKDDGELSCEDLCSVLCAGLCQGVEAGGANDG